MPKLYFYLDKRRKCKSTGQCAVYLAISHKKKTVYLSLQMELSPQEWDGGRRQVDASSPLAKRLNLMLDRHMLAAREVLLSLPQGPSHYSADELRDLIGERLFPERFEEARDEASMARLFERFIGTKTKRKTVESYEYTYKALCSYVPGFGSLSFDDINLGWLLEFDASLKKAGNSQNTVAVHMANFRAVNNFAIDLELTTSYPFRRYRVRKARTAKRSLPVEELRRLMTVAVEPWQERYRDYFMLTFYLIGINTVDLCLMRRDAVVNGRLEFRRSKTGRLYSVKLEPEALALLEKYRGRDYLLDVMDTVSDYEFFRARCNRALRRIGPSTRSGRGGKKSVEPLFPGISTYWARHTWATVAASLDIPKETIAAALGHGGNTVTDIYIDFDRRKVDAANRRVIDFVLGALAAE